MTNVIKMMELKSPLPSCPLCFSYDLHKVDYLLKGVSCDAILICNSCRFLFGYKAKHIEDKE